MAAHSVTGRHSWQVEDSTWNGAIGCTCGWTRSVFGHPTEEAAESGLQEAWSDHAGKAEPTRGPGVTSP